MLTNHNIDVLPMAAVGLILVILMVIMVPMVTTHAETPVDVPAAHTEERQVEEDIAVTLAKDPAPATTYHLFLNDNELKGTPDEQVVELTTGLQNELKKDPYKLVVIRADKDCLHVDVLEILAICRKAGALRMACATKTDTTSVYK